MISITTWQGGSVIQTHPSIPFSFRYAKKLLLATLDSNGQGRPFHVSFIKRSDGKVRHMRAVLVKREDGKIQSNKPYDYEKMGLMPVLDLDKQDWRTIALESVFSFELIFPNIFQS